METDIFIFPKQGEALNLLYNQHTRELLYGGAAGGAKTFLGCCWQITERIRIPESRGVIARARSQTFTYYHLANLISGGKANGFCIWQAFQI
jgi:phage terminase large subunit